MYRHSNILYLKLHVINTIKMQSEIKNDYMIKILNKSIEFPSELSAYMNKPKSIFIYGKSIEELWLMKFVRTLLKITRRLIEGNSLILA